MLNLILSVCACTARANLSNDGGVDRTYMDSRGYPTERSTKNVAACNGKVHVAWFHSSDMGHYGSIYYRRSLDGGITWEPKVLLTGPRSLHLELWVECKGDTVVVAYEVDNGGNFDIRYRLSTDGGATWSAERNPITSYLSANQEGPSLAFSGSTMHLAWADNRLALFSLYRIYYKRTTNLGNTWTSDAAQDLSDSPILRVDPAHPNMLHLMFMEYNPLTKRAKYRRSTDGGNTWSSTVDMSGYDAGGSEPFNRPIGSMAVYNNVIYYMWVDDRYGNREVLYKRSLNGGVSWLGPSNLSSTPTESWDPYVEAAPSGEARLYWMENTGGDWEIACKRTLDWGQNWSSLQYLTNNTALDGGVSVAYDNGYWHIVWTSNEAGNFEVYHAMDPCPLGSGEELGVFEKEKVETRKVRVIGKTLMLEGEGDYYVYFYDGRLKASGRVQSRAELKLDTGVWFVKFGGDLRKVIVR